VAWPGPPTESWGLALLLFAAAFVPLGELLRRIAARWAGVLRLEDPIERAVVDLYLGGATLYVLGSLPLGIYGPGLPGGVALAGALGLVSLLVYERRRRTGRAPGPPVAWERLASPWLLALLGACGLLYVLEVAVANGAATGNTFDSSILTMFLGLLTLHHQLPMSYAPVAPLGLAYPQGTTALLAAAQDLFGLPPARTPLLVTPLFLAIGPLGAYAWARRWFGTLAAGVAFGLLFALVASWTRVLVAGSNDFVFAFPLVLVVWGLVPRWAASEPPAWGDALGFGLLAGVTAALNPVGAQLTFLVLPLFALGAGGALRRHPVAWAARWAAALAVAIAFVVPSLAVLVAGRTSPGLVTGGVAPAPGTPPGFTLAQIIGQIDPMLFGANNVWLAPFPVLRIELAVLLVAGAALLLLPVLRRAPGEREFGWFAAAVLAGVAAMLAAQSAPVAGTGPLRALGEVTSGAELSILLFAVYAGVAALPLARALALLPLVEPPVLPLPAPLAAARRRRWRAARAVEAPSVPGAALPVAVAALIVAPGAAVTVTALPPYLGQLYADFGNVTTGDFALLTWATDHLPAGARVLAAPGSAAQFLPGTRPDVALLFPVTALANNASYRTVVAELDRGALLPDGHDALRALAVGYVAVTQNNTALWAPFDPAPLLAAPTEFPLLFHEGDAYLFGCTGT
jgi:hypothetical protein